jgi:uncharacterized protein DUF3108
MTARLIIALTTVALLQPARGDDSAPSSTGADAPAAPALASPAVAAPAVEAPDPAPAPPVAIAPGEEIEWRVDYLGVKTGRAKLTVGKPSGDIWPVIAQAKTEGVAKIVDIKEHYVSYWQAAQRTSNGTDLEALEVGDHHTERQRFDRGQGKATVTWWRKKNGERQKVVDFPRDAQDMASAMMWLRLQPLQDGARYEVPVFTGDETFTLSAVVAGRERVETDQGAYEAIKVDVQLGFKDRFQTRRPSHVWFTDDLRHVPVRMSAEFAVGSVVATMTTYTPGSQVASR